ncbi:uncharacterized protein LOC125662706 [Ostrea edulis]|uniref:uncharacterized protein LOC125662706 n=1 Tax=Ostrea edulis TaxID=37623 RepID=UPI0024AEC771|nr:uncharacterized protein LOC125662706 [Ostrea edulis]
MEFLKVLVVLLLVFHGSLSKPIGSGDELRVIVGQLERLVASLRQQVDYVDKPEYMYSMSDIQSWSESTPEFPIPGAKMLGKLLKPYFGSFPDGPYTSEMPLRPYDIMTKLSAWYNTEVTFRERGFGDIVEEIVKAHFQCAATKLNQMVFYVLKHNSREITKNDQVMNIHVREILRRWMMDTATMHNVAQEIVLTTQRQTFEEIIDQIADFQFEDIEEFLGKLRVLLWKTEQNKWSPVMFDEKLNQFLTDNDFVFKCPSINDLWRFHKKIASRFQERFPVNKLLTETDAWLRKVLPTYMPTDATPAITAILQVCTDYVKSVKLHFREVENHVSTGNAADVTNFMSKYLVPHQLKYLQSVFEFLNTGDTTNVMKMEEMGNPRQSNRCTGFNGRCE